MPSISPKTILIVLACLVVMVAGSSALLVTQSATGPPQPLDAVKPAVVYAGEAGLAVEEAVRFEGSTGPVLLQPEAPTQAEVLPTAVALSPTPDWPPGFWRLARFSY